MISSSHYYGDDFWNIYDFNTLWIEWLLSLSARICWYNETDFIWYSGASTIFSRVYITLWYTGTSWYSSLDYKASYTGLFSLMMIEYPLCNRLFWVNCDSQWIQGEKITLIVTMVSCFWWDGVLLEYWNDSQWYPHLDAMDWASRNSWWCCGGECWMLWPGDLRYTQISRDTRHLYMTSSPI